MICNLIFWRGRYIDEGKFKSKLWLGIGKELYWGNMGKEYVYIKLEN